MAYGSQVLINRIFGYMIKTGICAQTIMFLVLLVVFQKLDQNLQLLPRIYVCITTTCIFALLYEGHAVSFQKHNLFLHTINNKGNMMEPFAVFVQILLQTLGFSSARLIDGWFPTGKKASLPWLWGSPRIRLGVLSGGIGYAIPRIFHAQKIGKKLTGFFNIVYQNSNLLRFGPRIDLSIYFHLLPYNYHLFL